MATKVYYVQVAGLCSLIEAASERQARAEAAEDFGSRFEVICHIATEDEIDWVYGMGGRVPASVLARMESEQ